MKITSIEVQVVTLPLEGGYLPAWGRGKFADDFTFLIVRVDTDEGITGIGAAETGREVLPTLEAVAPLLIGEDPTQIERIATMLDDAGPPLRAPAHFLEIALWDIIGRKAGLPVHELWGAPRSRIMAYCATVEVRDAERRVADVERLIDEGFKAVKLRFHSEDPRDDVRTLEAVRNAVGDRMTIMVDANQPWVDAGFGGHWGWGFPAALEVARELVRLEVEWLEDPLPRSDFAGLARLRDCVPGLKIAGGEHLVGADQYRVVLDRGCFDIVIADALTSDGLSRLRVVGRWAEMLGLQFVPHTSHGMGVLANLPLALSLSRCEYIEFPHDPPCGLTTASRDQMLAQPTEIDGEGYVHARAAPGFGFELDEERVERHTVSSVVLDGQGSRKEAAGN